MLIKPKKLLKWGFALILLIVLALLYRSYNPIENSFFPRCSFRELTGYKCPGCGSQRAIHYLLNLEFYQAFKENVLLIISIPYLFAGFVFSLIKKPNERLLKFRKVFLGEKAIYIILTIIIAFWILRNITYCQQGITVIWLSMVT